MSDTNRRLEEVAHALDFGGNFGQPRRYFVDVPRRAELFDVGQQRREWLRPAGPERSGTTVRLGSDHFTVETALSAR